MNKRILLVSSNIIYFLLFTLALIFGNHNLTFSMLPLVNFIVILIISLTTYYSIYSEDIISPLFLFSQFYFYIVWIGFNFIINDLFQISRHEIISRNTFQKTYILTLLGYFSFVCGYFLIKSFNFSSKNIWKLSFLNKEKLKIIKKNENIILFFIFITLIVKAISQFYFNIGIAGIKPTKIPFIGIWYFLSKTGPLIGIMMLFFFWVKKGKKKIGILFLFLSLVYIILDIFAGWKSAPVKIAFISLLIFIVVNGIEFITIKKIIVFISIAIVVLFLYSNIYTYRKVVKSFYKKTNLSAESLKRKRYEGIDRVKHFYLRLMGGVLGNIRIIEYYENNQNLLGIGNLFTQKPSATKFVTKYVYRVPKTVVVSRASSLWGSLFVYGREIFLIVGFFVLGISTKLIFLSFIAHKNNVFIVVGYVFFCTIFIELIIGGLIVEFFKNCIVILFFILSYYSSFKILVNQKSLI